MLPKILVINLFAVCNRFRNVCPGRTSSSCTTGLTPSPGRTTRSVLTFAFGFLYQSSLAWMVQRWWTLVSQDHWRSVFEMVIFMLILVPIYYSRSLSNSALFRKSDWTLRSLGGLETGERKGSILASHSAAPGLILSVPRNLFWCCWDLLTALESEESHENVDRTFVLHSGKLVQQKNN